jgi:hypothetical protein
MPRAYPEKSRRDGVGLGSTQMETAGIVRHVPTRGLEV